MGVLIAPPGQPAPMKPDEFASGSIPNVVSFAFQNIGPPSPLYIQRDDVLVVEGISAIADSLNVVARLLLATPPIPGQPDTQLPPGAKITGMVGGTPIVTIGPTFKIPANNTAALVTIPLAEGYLLSLAVAAVTGSTIRGQTFVRAWIARGPASVTNPNAGLLLTADYVVKGQPTTWPGGRVISSVEGPGNLAVETVANPAAGADWSLAITTQQRWRIAALNAQLLTSAAAGNRTVRLQLKDSGAVVFYQSAPSANIPASTTAQVSAGPGQVTSTVDATTINVTLPGTPYLTQTMTLAVSTLGLLAGDQWSAIRVATEEWMDNF